MFRERQEHVVKSSMAKEAACTSLPLSHYPVLVKSALHKKDSDVREPQHSGIIIFITLRHNKYELLISCKKPGGIIPCLHYDIIY